MIWGFFIVAQRAAHRQVTASVARPAGCLVMSNRTGIPTRQPAAHP
ncbi:MAG: hypothetical protein IAE86_08860 [Burkholderiaceae bacterium]|nr:hypothetical protein [Burkholderiaceae bacterium]